LELYLQSPNISWRGTLPLLLTLKKVKVYAAVWDLAPTAVFSNLPFSFAGMVGCGFPLKV
jgi:hypothetical protein